MCQWYKGSHFQHFKHTAPYLSNRSKPLQKRAELAGACDSTSCLTVILLALSKSFLLRLTLGHKSQEIALLSRCHDHILPSSHFYCHPLPFAVFMMPTVI